MSAATKPAGAAPRGTPDWHSIPWKKVLSTVRRLQARIVKALQKGRWGKVKARRPSGEWFPIPVRGLREWTGNAGTPPSPRPPLSAR